MQSDFRIKEYEEIWRDIRAASLSWRRVTIPTHCVFDMGASEAVYSSVTRDIVLEKSSPIIFMKAQKNEIEREGMRKAHIIDGAAMCETLSYIEQKVWTIPLRRVRAAFT